MNETGKWVLIGAATSLAGLLLAAAADKAAPRLAPGPSCVVNLGGLAAGTLVAYRKGHWLAYLAAGVAVLAVARAVTAVKINEVIDQNTSDFDHIVASAYGQDID